MDAQEQLNRKYTNSSIYTSAFYADPDDALDNRAKLFEGAQVLYHEPTRGLALLLASDVDQQRNQRHAPGVVGPRRTQELRTRTTPG